MRFKNLITRKEKEVWPYVGNRHESRDGVG